MEIDYLEFVQSIHIFSSNDGKQSGHVDWVYQVNDNNEDNAISLVSEILLYSCIILQSFFVQDGDEIFLGLYL